MLDQFDASINGGFVRVRVASVDDSGPQQLVAVQGLLGQHVGEAVRVQHHGASSVPPKGAEGYALVGGGRMDKAYILGLEDPDNRPKKLPSGAKAIYDASGNIIKLIGSGGAVFDFGRNGWSVKFKGGTVTSDGADVTIAVNGANLHLGGPGGSPVMTVAGPSKNVFALV